MEIVKDNVVYNIGDGTVVKIINFQASKLGNMYNVQVDDLVSLGHSVLSECMEKWNPEKSLFSTFLYRMLSSRMVDYVRRERKRKTNIDINIMENALVTNITPCDMLEAKEKPKQFSSDVSFVAITLLDHPERFGINSTTRTKRQVKKKIRECLSNEYKWSKERIKYTFQVLRQAYS